MVVVVVAAAALVVAAAAAAAVVVGLWRAENYLYVISCVYGICLYCIPYIITSYVIYHNNT